MPFFPQPQWTMGKRTELLLFSRSSWISWFLKFHQQWQRTDKELSSWIRCVHSKFTKFPFLCFPFYCSCLLGCCSCLLATLQSEDGKGCHVIPDLCLVWMSAQIWCCCMIHAVSMNAVGVIAIFGIQRTHSWRCWVSCFCREVLSNVSHLFCHIAGERATKMFFCRDFFSTVCPLFSAK